MVLCKCRKATKLYCFVHKVPVCEDCVCTNGHQLCVVRTYSEWVIDGDYDWPPKCSLCQAVLQPDAAVTRLGCLHVFHGECLLNHLQGFPLHTAPAGYNCPECSTPVWPPKCIKDDGSLILTLKQVISQAGLSPVLLGSDILAQRTEVAPAFNSDPLSAISLETTGPHPDANGTLGSDTKEGKYASGIMANGSDAHFPLATGSMSMTSIVNPGTMTRKPLHRIDKMVYAEPQDSEDNDKIRRKYGKRGHFQNQWFKHALPFWSNAVPTLPITAPLPKDVAENIIEGHLQRRRASGCSIKKMILVVSIISCVATMLVLYYRLVQGGPLGDGGFFNQHQATEDQRK